MLRQIMSLSLVLFLLFLLIGCSGSDQSRELTQYQLNVAVIQGQGSVSPSEGTYPENKTVSLTATPEEGWRFKEWGGDLIYADDPDPNPAEIVMDSDLQITASFVEVQFLLALTDQTIEEGSPLDFTIGVVNGFAGTITASGDSAFDSGNLADYYDSVSRTFHWTPTFNEAGSYLLTFTAEEEGLIDSQTITITVSNIPAITTLAGSGAYGDSGDGGDALSAKLKRPFDVAVDEAGNIYIADDQSDRIRKVYSQEGTITTIVGTGTAGDSGEGGPAVQAELDSPRGVAVDAAGNIYIADSSNNKIKKVDTQGIITTIAGTGTAGFSGDGGLAVNAQLSNPSAIEVDNCGNIYLADQANYRVRKIDEEGIITTVAGTGTPGDTGDGGLAVNAQLSQPVAVAVDSTGNLYIADRLACKIRQVSPAGIINTVAGTGQIGYSGTNLPAVNTYLNYPNGVSTDQEGNIYISDTFSYLVRKVDTEGIITSVAGIPETSGYSGDGGVAVDAQFKMPLGLTVDSEGNIYVADGTNYCIRKIY